MIIRWQTICKRTNIKTRVNGDGHVNIAEGGTDEEDAGSLLSDEVDSVDNTALGDTGIRRVKSFPGRCEFVLYNNESGTNEEEEESTDADTDESNGNDESSVATDVEDTTEEEQESDTAKEDDESSASNGKLVAKEYLMRM